MIPGGLFDRTLAGLRTQSAGWRESGAVLVGQITEARWEASDVYFHHELGNERSGPLFLDLSERAKFTLYEKLRLQQLRLVALIHTHPEEWVGLSVIDEENQISSRIGFWSLVVPHYGREPWHLNEIGVHERLEIGWRRLTEGELTQRVSVSER